MKNFIVIMAVVAVALSTTTGCKKDYASNWVGTYTGNVGVSSTVNRIIISKVTDTKVQLQLQNLLNGSYVTYVTLGSASVTKDVLTMNEDGPILGFTDTYHFTGSAQLTGNTIAVSGQGVSTTNSSDVKSYTFTGSK